MYFPSIHDDIKMWPLFRPSELPSGTPGKVNNSISGGSAYEKSYSRPSNVEHNTASRQEDSGTTQLSWSNRGPLVEPEYRPLEVFSPSAGGTRSPRSEHAEVCELSIRLKEMELCTMMGEQFDLPRYTFLRNIKYKQMAT